MEYAGLTAGLEDRNETTETTKRARKAHQAKWAYFLHSFSDSPHLVCFPVRLVLVSLVVNSNL